MAKLPSVPPSQLGPIVLVDDEAELVQAVSTMLRAEFGEARVRSTSNPTEAQAWVRREKPGVLITDAKMPGVSGMELVTSVQDTWGPTPTIVMTAFPSEEVRLGARRGTFLYLPKPFSFRSLLDAVRQLEAAPPASFSGAIAVSTLTDLLQLYALSGSTGLMLIRSGEHRGEIWFERGQVTHSRTGEAQGFDAFCAILRWPKGSFSWQTRRAETQTISMGISELMIEALRIMDEQALHAPPPASSPPPPPSPRRSILPPTDAQTQAQRQLERLRDIDGFIGAALVDSESGSTLGTLGGDASLDLATAIAGNIEVMRAKLATVKKLDLRDNIEDMLITLGKQYHLIRPLRSRPDVFFYLAVDRSRANLALARMTLADAEGEP